ncbi:MAG TPA: hypothetical protein VI643_03865 [Planctomycetota bacterium]|nr:hypothetical protein [Planctomycetota bacterium]
MAALTAATRPPNKIFGYHVTISLPIVNADVIYHGALVGIPDPTTGGMTSSRGYAVPWQNQQGLMWQGFAVGFNYITSATDLQNNQGTGDTAASPPPQVIVTSGATLLGPVSVSGAAAQTDVGRLVYSTTDNYADLSTTASQGAEIGEIAYYHTGAVCTVMTYGKVARSAALLVA